MDRSLERLLLREGVMHGWGHAQDKGVTHLNLGNVPESKTGSSGFPTFGAEGIGGGEGVIFRRGGDRIGNCGPGFQWTLPAEFSRTTLESTAVSDLSGRCEQKPMPT